jgi:hypothetical protein
MILRLSKGRRMVSRHEMGVSGQHEGNTVKRKMLDLIQFAP